MDILRYFLKLFRWTKKANNKTENSGMSKFEDAFELTGHGRFNYIVTLTAGLVLLYTMMESLAIGYIMTVAECGLELTVMQKGLINSAAFIGILSTGIFWGYLSDQYGRRRIMLPALIASCAVSFSSTWSTNFISMFLLRLFTGCLVSASSATVFAYIGEMHSNARRSTAIMYASTAIGITFIILPLLGWLILSGTWSFKVLIFTVTPWRVFMWTWTGPGLSAALILVFLPESPRFLLANKGPQQAREVLARMYACNYRKKKEEFPVTTITDATKVASRHGFKVAFMNLVHLGQPPLRRCVILSHICMFMVFMLNSALYTWLPDIMHLLYTNFSRKMSICAVMVEYYTKKNDSKSLSDIILLTDSKGCDEKIVHYMVYPTSLIMGIMCASTYIIIGHVVKKWSKIKFYCLMLGTCSIMLAVSALIAQPLVAVILYVIGVCSGATASLLSAISVEVFPTSVRALALCTLYMFGRLGAAVGSTLVGVAVHHHCEVVFLIMTLGTAGNICFADVAVAGSKGSEVEYGATWIRILTGVRKPSAMTLSHGEKTEKPPLNRFKEVNGDSTEETR